MRITQAACTTVILTSLIASYSQAVVVTFQEGVGPNANYQMHGAMGRADDPADRNRGDFSVIQVGYISATAPATFGWLGIDVSAIPYGSTINSAALTLTAQAASGETTDESHSLTLHELNESFHELSVSYLDRDLFLSDSWTTPGGDFNPTPVSSTSGNPLNISAGDEFVLASSASFTASIDAAVNGSGVAYYALTSDSNHSGNRGLFRFHSDDASTASERPVLEVDYTSPLEVTVDRTSGNISVQNVSGSSLDNIIGYSLTSSSGSLRRAGWDPIKGKYDGSPGGDTTFDSNEWTTLPGAGGPYDLSEGVFTGSGGSLASTQTLDFGAAWLKSNSEDIVFQLLFDDGSDTGKVSDYPVTFVPGAGGHIDFEFGDLDFDGDIDQDDFLNVFVPAFLTDTTSLSEAQSYLAGDLNADGTTDVIDFHIFNNIYKQQPGATPLQFPAAPAPEPTAIAILGLAGLGILAHRRRQLLCVCAAMCLAGTLAPDASAVTVRNLTTGELLFFDDFESAPEVSSEEYGSVSNTLDADPVVPLGSPLGAAWHDGQRVNSPGAPEPQATDIQVVNGSSGNDPGAFHGSNYLRAQRSVAQVIAHPLFAEQSTDGDVIRMSSMVYIIPGLTNSSGPGITAWGHLTDGTTVDPVISNQFRAEGDVYNSDGSSGSSSTSEVDGANFFATEGEWNYVALEYTIGGDSYDYYLNDKVETLPLRSTNQDDLDSIFTFGFAGNTWSSTLDRGIYVDSAPELTLLVNQATGEMTIVNDLSAELTIDSYQIKSQTPNAFVDGALSGIDGSAGVGGTWTPLASTPQLVAEGALGDSTIDVGASASLGTVYNTTTAAEDLILELHVAGTLDTLLIPSLNIEYVTGGILGDFNADGTVDSIDYAVWRENLGLSDATLGGNADNTDGLNIVNQADFDAWLANYGASTGGAAAGGSSAAPEPTAIMILGLAGVGILAHRRRQLLCVCAAMFLAGTLASDASAATTTTADYLFGDGGDGGSDGAAVSTIWEELDASGFNDLGKKVGAPNYELISDVGGGYAGSGVYGVDFTGDDALIRGTTTTTETMGNTSYLELNPTFGTGIEMWVYPRSDSGRQVLMFNEKNDVGIAITDSGQWTQIAAGHDDDDDITPVMDVVTNQWTHLMQHTYSIGSPNAPAFAVGSGTGGQYITVLYVDGKIASAHIDNHDIDENGDLVFGAEEDVASPDEFFDGVIDRARFYRSSEFNLLADNESVVDEVLQISTGNGSPISGGNVMPGDINLDNAVDSTDESLFAANWMSSNRYEGFHGDVFAGDLDTWQQGDFNLDGLVNLHDLFIIHDALEPLGGFNFSLLESTGQAPEPSACLLVVIASACCLASRRSQS